MADIFDEVQEDLQREYYTKLVMKWAMPFCILIVTVLVSTLLYIWWVDKQDSKIAYAGELFNQAQILQIKKNNDQAKIILDQIIAKNDTEFTSLAIFQKAKMLISDGQEKQALSLYSQFIGDKNASAALKDLARLAFVSIAIDQQNKEYDQQINEYLEILTKPGQVWYYSAYELKGLYCLKNADYQAAQEIFNLILYDKNASESLHKRADLIISILNDHK